MIKTFTCATVSDAPASPGLYAWYGRVEIGESDFLKLLVDDNRDLGEERLRTLLARHTQRFTLPDMHVRITSSFEAEWSATCQENTVRGFVEALAAVDAQRVGDGKDKDAEVQKRRIGEVSRTMAKQKNRQLLKDVLEASVPTFSSPLYIGVTDDLRRRLREHVQLLQRLADAVKKNPTERDRLKQVDRSEFAIRAIASGFDESYLEVHVLNFEDLEADHHTPTELRDIAGAAEWLLNRWHRPYLGRR